VSETTPRRVRVTSPRTGAARAQRVPAAREIDAQTVLGEVYMSSLLRSQLRLALLALTTLAVLVGGIPLVFWLLPELSSVEVLAVPLPWLLLAFVVYPFLFVIGWLYVRAAERNERDFTDVLDRS
jgi:O-antigen/teichoic acid export membrane protein